MNALWTKDTPIGGRFVVLPVAAWQGFQAYGARVGIARLLRDGELPFELRALAFAGVLSLVASLVLGLGAPLTALLHLRFPAWLTVVWFLCTLVGWIGLVGADLETRAFTW